MGLCAHRVNSDWPTGVVTLVTAMMMVSGLEAADGCAVHDKGGG